MQTGSANKQTLREAIAGARCVKWKTANDELQGIAAIVARVIADDDSDPRRICLAVPNLSWGDNMRVACKEIGLKSGVCIAPSHLSAAAQGALAALRLLAAKDDPQALANWQTKGQGKEAAETFIERNSQLRGQSLIHVLGMDSLPEFRHVMLHVEGDEDAEQLFTITSEQLKTPSMPADEPLIPIMHYHAITGDFDQIFLVACVDGFVPGPVAFEAPTQEARQKALNADRQAFATALGAAPTVTISCFTEVGIELAHKAHIRFVRQKTEAGQVFAIAAPTSFLQEAGPVRPSTESSQAVLRSFGLN